MASGAFYLIDISWKQVDCCRPWVGLTPSTSSGLELQSAQIAVSGPGEIKAWRTNTSPMWKWNWDLRLRFAIQIPGRNCLEPAMA